MGNTNTGTDNSGDYNSGNCNSGNCNSGDYNSGYCNSGDYNSGYRNSGDYNSGYRNSGYRNSGYRNSGDYNSGNYNSGMFNTDEPCMRMFNKQTDIKYSDFINSNRYLDFSDFNINVWVDEKIMTDDEKKDYPTYKTTGGYLKKIEYKEAWAVFWRTTSEENKKKIFNLPNFDWQIFTEITGIEKEPSLKGKEVEVKLDGKTYKAIIQ
jgi:hypothetical protein